MLWNLLNKLQVQKFHCSLKTLHLHALSERTAFCEELQWSSLWTSRVFQQPSIKGSGLSSPINVVDGISMQGHYSADSEVFPLFLQRTQAISCCSLSYRVVLHHVFSLAGIDLVASCVISRMLHISKQSCPLREVWPLD